MKIALFLDRAKCTRAGLFWQDVYYKTCNEYGMVTPQTYEMLNHNRVYPPHFVDMLQWSSQLLLSQSLARRIKNSGPAIANAIRGRKNITYWDDIPRSAI